MGKNTNEKHLQRLLKVLEEWKAEDWQSRFNDILDSFEDFLMEHPEPPAHVKERFGGDLSKYDYWQIVLPEDFQDPFEDDLGNIRRLRGEFESTPSTMALEHLLISRNYFIYENGHAEPIAAPRPLLMLESTEIEGRQVDWDCCITIFADGSFYAYNLEKNEEEVLGENVKDILENQMEVLSELSLVIPVEGRDYGILKSE